MVTLLLKNGKFWLVVVVSGLISALIPGMPNDTIIAALTVIGVLFGGALTGAAVVTSLINEEGLRKIYERRKENYDRLINTMRASLALLLISLSIMAILFFLPLDDTTLTLNANRWHVVVPIWRLSLFVITGSVGLSLFAAWEVVEAVIGMSRIRFELAVPRSQTDKRAESS